MNSQSFKYLFVFTVLSAALFFTSISGAAAQPMLFWYPGEAGSTAEAQPILDEFTKYLESRIPNLKLSPKYFNTVDEGLAFINNSKPVLGIISYAAWEEYKSKFPEAKVWLATNPLPYGKKEESYLLVSGSAPGGAGMPIYSSEPMTKNFIVNSLGFSQAASLTPAPTSQILMKLKAIGSGEVKAMAVLTPMEGATLKKMTAPWTKNIKTVAVSKPVPTARVVLFSSMPKIDSLKSTLLEIKNDPNAKEILDELRLAGFSEP
jgi:hypothetical protein